MVAGGEWLSLYGRSGWMGISGGAIWGVLRVREIKHKISLKSRQGKGLSVREMDASLRLLCGDDRRKESPLIEREASVHCQECDKPQSHLSLHSIL